MAIDDLGRFTGDGDIGQDTDHQTGPDGDRASARTYVVSHHFRVEAGQSWGVMLYFLTALWVAYWGISALGQSLPVTAGMQDGWLRYVLGVAYFYPTLFLSYAVFHVANRLKVVNWLFTHTTLTHFWGRYLEPNTRYKHLVPKKTKKPISG